jgi:tetratricopeptide (TPR) repeat protein
MRVRFFAQATGALLAAMPLLAQQQAQPQSQQAPQQQSQPGTAAQQPQSSQQAPQQQGPHPKSQQEMEALQKVKAALQAHNPDAEIQAINNVLENFTDTDYKPVLLNIGMQAAAQKGDYAQTLVWGDRIIQNDPNDVQARVVLAEDIAQHTRENDLDKEQSLKKVDNYANKVLELLKAANTPPAGFPQDKWTDFKNQLTGQAHDALGLAADLRKKYPDAVVHFKDAISSDPNPVSTAHLAKAYVDNKQYDDAITTADKVLAMNEVPPSVKQYAEQQKQAATKLKTAK